jgi:hypothetical protein
MNLQIISDIFIILDILLWPILYKGALPYIITLKIIFKNPETGGYI